MAEFSDIEKRFRRGEIDKFEMAIEKYKRVLKYVRTDIPPYYQQIFEKLERKCCPNCGEVKISERWIAIGK